MKRSHKLWMPPVHRQEEFSFKVRIGPVSDSIPLPGQAAFDNQLGGLGVGQSFNIMVPGKSERVSSSHPYKSIHHRVRLLSRKLRRMFVTKLERKNQTCIRIWRMA
jgi:hypothetical protein